MIDVDVQAVLLFLRNTSFGSEYNFRLIDPKTTMEFDTVVNLDEINFLIRGSMKIQGQLLKSGNIFILEPYEIADPEFIEDCEIICIKSPNITNDKIVVKKVQAHQWWNDSVDTPAKLKLKFEPAQNTEVFFEQF